MTKARAALITTGLASLILAITASQSQATTKTIKVGTAPGGAIPGKRLARLTPEKGHQLAAFSEGCFWGTEKMFRQIPGVTATAVGFMGGHLPFPTYEQAHTTGHAETVLVEFDPKRVTYKDLLGKFWTLRHPAEPSEADKHHPFRSAIWTFDNEELTIASQSLQAQRVKEHARLVTKVQPAQPFYLAEAYHQQYSERTGTDACPIP